jgi:hypothetical protein
MNKILYIPLILLTLTACSARQTSQNTTPPVSQTPATTIPTSTPSTSFYTNPQLGVSFSYPTTYQAPKLSNNELISLISPLDPNRHSKNSGLSETELKVEIYVVKNYGKNVEEAAKEADKQSDELGTRFDTKEWRSLAGQKAYYRKGSGLGTFENYILVVNNNSYTIAKYPAETTRQSEFDSLLQTIQFSK